MTEPPTPLVEVASAAEWRQWLRDHRDEHPGGVWLVYFKPHAHRPCAGYGESVEEALCFGWVDSLIRRIDNDRYARKFTPRKPDSNWSASNRKRVRKLISKGRMTRHGMALVEAAKKSGRWKDHQPPEISLELPRELAAGLRNDHSASQFFKSLTDKQRAQFITWINGAKRPDTRVRRISECLELLGRGQKLGMK